MADDDATKQREKLAWSAEQHIESPGGSNIGEMEKAKLADEVLEVVRNRSTRDAPAAAGR